MTANQIAYQNMLEGKRANREREKENYRSNFARETEENRSNLAKELNAYRTYVEQARANKSQEAIGRANVRAQQDRNDITEAHNFATEQHDINRLAAELAGLGVKQGELDVNRMKQQFYERMEEMKLPMEIVDTVWDDVIDLIRALYPFKN